MRFTTPISCTIMLFVNLGASTQAYARRTYPVRLPSNFACSTCHLNANGGGIRNSFGQAYGNSGVAPHVWNEDLANLDSDNDGYTNGAELGDAMGIWNLGDSGRTALSQPGDGNKTPCGNNQIDAKSATTNEECDGTNLNNKTCLTLNIGFTGGTLSCAPNSCSFDTTMCTSFVCGNNTLEDGEECEGTNFGAKSCADFGATGGDLSCDANCKIDATQCDRTQCGNFMIDGNEECDGDNLNNTTCITLNKGFTSGALSCSDQCIFDTSACITKTCGNSTLDADEPCDGANFGNTTCTSLGYKGGSLACSSTCTLDESGCTDDDPDMGMADMSTPDQEMKEGIDLATGCCAQVQSNAPRHRTLPCLLSLLAFVFLRRRKA